MPSSQGVVQERSTFPLISTTQTPQLPKAGKSSW
jgi:hypothetical protein